MLTPFCATCDLSGGARPAPSVPVGGAGQARGRRDAAWWRRRKPARRSASDTECRGARGNPWPRDGALDRGGLAAAGEADVTFGRVGRRGAIGAEERVEREQHDAADYHTRTRAGGGR